MGRTGLVAFVVFVLVGPAFAGDDSSTSRERRNEPVSMADPEFLERYAATYRFHLGRPASIRPAPDGRSVLFLRSGPRSFVRALYELDLATGEERVLATVDALLGGAEETVTPEERARRERLRVVAKGIVSYQLSRDGRRILVPLSGRLFLVERTTGEIREIGASAAPVVDARLSPDGRRVACVRDADVWILDGDGDGDGDGQRRLTDDAGEGVTYGLAEFVAQEEMGRVRGLWWSPDSERIAFQRTDVSGVGVLHLADPTHPARAPEPRPYPRAGEPNAEVRLGIVAATGGRITWVDWDRDRFEYLASVRWAAEGPLTLLVQDRRQSEMRLLEVRPSTGTTRTLLSETDDAWVEIDQEVPLWLPDGKAFLWTTSRRGARQIELRRRDGSFARPLTAPSLGLRRIVGYVARDRAVLAIASADPTEDHLWSIPLDPGRGGARRLSTEPGIHSAVANREGSLWVHAARPLTGEPRWEAVGPDGPTGRRLRSVAERPAFDPNLSFAKVGDSHPLHAVLVRPRNYDPDTRYPVIDHVYGGPTALMVRKDPSRYLLDQWMADHGYVVVRIDGRGTPHRGREWIEVVKGNLADVPLADHTRGIRLLGEAHPELDLSRVGVYGWSFGGYLSAMAVMREPGRFRAGVAGAPVADWLDYDTHYTERYMGLPQENPQGYEAASVLTWAPRLERPLLIVHGTVDDNVYFTHSLKLADALFRAGKRFEFLPLPGFTHMVPDPVVTERLYTRIMEFLETGLSGRE